jgi:hypothetical protein
MSQGPSRPTPADPVLAAIENAPMGPPESDEEKRIMAEAHAHAQAGGLWFTGEEVTAAIAARRLDALLKK